MKLVVLVACTLWNTRIGASYICHPQQLHGHGTNNGNLPHRGCLYMGYLDDISPVSPDNNRKDKDRSKDGNSRSNGKVPASSGVVPSGRGPLGSYLDAVANGGDGRSEEELSKRTPGKEDTPQRQRASGSGAYLTNFLTGEDDARTDVRNLLTQRSVQSFLRLCEECRDPHSAKWIATDF